MGVIGGRLQRKVRLRKKRLKPILRGMVNVHAANMQQFEKSEDGDNPRCKNALGTFFCERCGRDVRGTKDACPDVPTSQRWKINYPVQ
jgi:hypothetical protein